MNGDTPQTSFATRRPVAILMIFLATVVFGFLAVGRLPLALMPELSYPTVTVRTEYPGAAPEEVENDISRPVEEALGVIGGLSRISSISRADVSDVVLEFSWDTDMRGVVQEVREKIDQTFLPDGVEAPTILRYDPSLDPIVTIGMPAASSRSQQPPRISCTSASPSAWDINQSATSSMSTELAVTLASFSGMAMGIAF